MSTEKYPIYTSSDDLFFYSKSSDETKRVLSNFWSSEIEITPDLCDEFNLPPITLTLPSIEAVYQTFKYRYLKSDHENVFDTIISLPKTNSGSFYKMLGSKKCMALYNAELDTVKWDKHKDQVMKMGITARYRTYKLYGHLLDCAKQYNFIWKHKGDAYWGLVYKHKQWTGQNQLGKLMREVADEN